MTETDLAVPATREKSSRETFRVLGKSILLIALPFGILDFVLPIYGKSIGANAMEIGLFFSAFSLMLVIMRPLVGAGIDRFGRRPFLLAGLAGYMLTMFAFAAADRVVFIVLARVLQGLSASFLWLAANAITSDLAASDARGRTFGSLDEYAYRGGILGTFIGFTLLLGDFYVRIPGINVSLQMGDMQSAWPVLFVLYGAVSLLAVLTAWRSLPETRRNGHVSSGQPIRWSRTWLLLLMVTAVTGASWAMVSPMLMIYLQEKFQAPIDHLALAFLPSALIWALLPSRLGRLSDRFGRKTLMVLSMLAAAATSVLIPTLSSLVGLALLWGLQALFYAAGDPAERALVADLTGDDQRGRAFGFYTMAAGLGAAAGPFLGGWLYDVIGQKAPFFANGVVLALSAGLLAWLLKEPDSEEVSA